MSAFGLKKRDLIREMTFELRFKNVITTVRQEDNNLTRQVFP